MKMGLECGFNSSLIRAHETERGLAWIPRIRAGSGRGAVRDDKTGELRFVTPADKEYQRSPHTHKIKLLSQEDTGESKTLALNQ